MNRLSILIVLLVLLLCMSGAAAEEAKDFTEQCTVTASPGKYKLNRLYDRDYGTTYVCSEQRNPYVEIKAPDGENMSGIYVCFGDKLVPWIVQAEHDGKWETVYTSPTLYPHEYVTLENETHVRIKPVDNRLTTFTIGEIYVFGAGELPSFVQFWEPAPEKADLMILVAHPDDEILFMGGTIPYYAGELGYQVVVAYMTCNTMERRSELLNGLWEMGVRTYPVIGNYWDKYTKKLDTCYDAWGKSSTYQYITGLLRQFKPEVVITHDVKGEYGHGGHLVCADALMKCVKYAADSSKYTASYKQYGTWEVKKLYYHLGKTDVIEMDWDRPLDAFDGRTGFEVAKDAYLWHASQQTAGQKNAKTGKYEYFEVEPKNSEYSCYKFSLVYTTVGADEVKNDFFEHVIK